MAPRRISDCARRCLGARRGGESSGVGAASDPAAEVEAGGASMVGRGGRRSAAGEENAVRVRALAWEGQEV